MLEAMSIDRSRLSLERFFWHSFRYFAITYFWNYIYRVHRVLSNSVILLKQEQTNKFDWIVTVMNGYELQMVPDADTEVWKPVVAGAARWPSPTRRRDAGSEDGATGRPRPLPVPRQQFPGAERGVHRALLPRETADANRTQHHARGRRSTGYPHLHLVR